MTSETTPSAPLRAAPSEGAPTAAPARARHRRSEAGRVFRRTSLPRAVAEGVLIYLAGRLLVMVPATFWPEALFPLVLVLRLALTFSPPIWAALRVKSTRREKMSRRFWLLGPVLALLCTATDAVVALALGEAQLMGGAAGPPDAVRLAQTGPHHLTLGAFVGAEVSLAITLTIYFTIAVVCTRLANGGFLRFTMPAGNGRVTL